MVKTNTKVNDFNKVNNYIGEIKNIIIKNIKNLAEHEEINEIKPYTELFNIIKPLDQKLEILNKEITANNSKQSKTKAVKAKTIKKDVNTTKTKAPTKKSTKITSETKKKVGRPKKRHDLKAIPENTTGKTFSLDYDFTSKKPMSYTLFNNKHEVKSWKQLFESASKDMVEKFPTEVNKLLESEELKGNKIAYVSVTNEGMRSPLEVKTPDNKLIFIETYGSSNVLIELLGRIMHALGLNNEDIAIELKK